MPEELEDEALVPGPDIKDPDDVHGFCSECGSQQSDRYMNNSPFDVPPCQFCGGVTYVGYAERQDRDKARFDARRNIGHDPDVKYTS